jgi:hypothetical protein
MAEHTIKILRICKHIPLLEGLMLCQFIGTVYVSQLMVFVDELFLSEVLLMSYSNDIRSKGLRPQLICCAPFLSIAQYFRKLYVLYLKIWMAIVVYPMVQMTIV